MDGNLNTVKTERKRYHHGTLRPALIEAALALIAERGVDDFSLRETARRAGVSPAAPAHHFGDMQGLLTAIAVAAFKDLSVVLDDADRSAGAARGARVRAQGLAYVGYALRNRARYDLMWRKALLDGEDDDYIAASARTFDVLDRAMRGDARIQGGPADPETAPSIACWSLVHGFARLALDGMFGVEAEALERARCELLPKVLEMLRIEEN